MATGERDPFERLPRGGMSASLGSWPLRERALTGAGGMRSMSDDAANVMVQEYAAALRAYLHAHPRAADTLSGIVIFWLQCRPQSREEVAAVEMALNQLVAESLLIKRAGLDGRVLYARAEGIPTAEH